jgi:hypothetical protein
MLLRFIGWLIFLRHHRRWPTVAFPSLAFTQIDPRFADSGEGDVKALQGREELRLRIGDYRLFFVCPAADTIEIRRAFHRREAYR